MNEQEKIETLKKLDGLYDQLDTLEKQLLEVESQIEEAKDIKYDKGSDDEQFRTLKKDIYARLNEIKNIIIPMKDEFNQYLDNPDEDVAAKTSQVKSRHNDVFQLFRDVDWKSLYI